MHYTNKKFTPTYVVGKLTLHSTHLFGGSTFANFFPPRVWAGLCHVTFLPGKSCACHSTGPYGPKNEVIKKKIKKRKENLTVSHCFLNQILKMSYFFHFFRWRGHGISSHIWVLADRARDTLSIGTYVHDFALVEVSMPPFSIFCSVQQMA